MQFIHEIARRIWYWFRRDQLDAELREEMAAHLDMLAHDSDPVSAKRRMGNLTRWGEISRETWGWSGLESMARDIGYGARLLVKSPGFTLTACLSLAIGLGATVGIFSLMNALLFKTLPIPKAQQLWGLGHGALQERQYRFSYPAFTALEHLNNTGVHFFAVSGLYVRADYGTSMRNTVALIVSGDTFRALQIKPYAGRLLNANDDLRGIPQGANCVLSYRLWQSQFHSDLSAIGKHIAIGAVQFTIVGITPPEFFGLSVGSYHDLILPISAYAATNPAMRALDDRGWTWLHLMARVPPSTSVQQWTTRLNTIYPAVLRESAFSPKEAAKPDQLYLVSMASGISGIWERFSKPLYVLLTMTSLILLIACANLANLLLVRSMARHRELAVRLSVGASRARVIRQLLTESALIALLGAVLSVPFYLACTHGLLTFPREVFLDVSPDWRLMGVTLALLSFTVLLFGFAPAVKATHSGLNLTLAENSQRLLSQTIFSNWVVIAQIGLSLVLLSGAALLSFSLYRLRTFDAGFRRNHLLIVDIDTTQSLQKNTEVTGFFDELLKTVRALPGVRSVAASVIVPLTGRSWEEDYQILHTSTQEQVPFHSFENWVTPSYFDTLGTPLIMGRSLATKDIAQSPHIAVINTVFAKSVFGSGNPIGRQINEISKKDIVTIVGVVADARYRNLHETAPPTVYRPIAQLPASFGFLLTLNLEVWTSTPALSLAKPITQLVRHMNSGVFADAYTFDTLVDFALSYQRLLTALSVTFGVVGLVLSVVGVYGLSAYSAARRTAEVGIRMALGATPGSILRLMLSEHLRLLAIGISVGVLMSLALTRFLQAWLFGISATDPLLFCTALLTLSAFSVPAALLPALRAALLNPAEALRSE